MKVWLLIAVVVGSVALHGCSEEVATDPLVDDLRDLCDATAEELDLDGQESAFFDRAHDAVHELARRVTEIDPGIGAELLEAKQEIESDLTETFDEPIPTRSFERLIDASNRALSEIDLERVSC